MQYVTPAGSRLMYEFRADQTPEELCKALHVDHVDTVRARERGTNAAMSLRASGADASSSPPPQVYAPRASIVKGLGEPNCDVRVVDGNFSRTLTYDEQALGLSKMLSTVQPVFSIANSGPMLKSIAHSMDTLMTATDENWTYKPVACYVHFKDSVAVILTTCSDFGVFGLHTLATHNIAEAGFMKHRSLYIHFKTIVETYIEVRYPKSNTRYREIDMPFYLILKFEPFVKMWAKMKEGLHTAIEMHGAFLALPPKEPALVEYLEVVASLWDMRLKPVWHHMIMNITHVWWPLEIVEMHYHLAENVWFRFPGAHYIMIYVLEGTLRLKAAGLGYLPPARETDVIILPANLYYSVGDEGLEATTLTLVF